MTKKRVQLEKPLDIIELEAEIVSKFADSSRILANYHRFDI